MRDRSVVVVRDATKDALLLYRRRKEPYLGLYDLVGGSCHSGESALECALRALERYAGISREEIALTHVMDFAFQTTGWCVQVFSGELLVPLTPPEGEDPLEWLALSEDYFDPGRFAGEGYIGHILSHMAMQTADE